MGLLEKGAEKRVVIIGAGPAGLTAARELLRSPGFHPVILEAEPQVGGISRTVDYKGNKIDIGGHRFFSKSERVMDWWEEILPLQGAPSRDDRELGRAVPFSGKEGAPDPEVTDRVMLVRNRLSRIFFLGRFFDYPLSLGLRTLAGLGLPRTVRIAASYARARIFPIRDERNLEEFFINRFGRELYGTFFRDYTEKVWGVPCRDIGAEWGAQRIKGLSVTRVILHALRSLAGKGGDVSQKGTETSLIERFLYPKLGPGQLWEEVAELVRAKGGEILLGREVTGVRVEGGRVVSVDVRDALTGAVVREEGEWFLSSMPVRDLVEAMGDAVPEEVKEVSRGLVYRDFVTVGLLARTMRGADGAPVPGGTIPDNWIYVQESSVRMGRLQLFNNWSPYLVGEKGAAWLGLEYFCTEGDDFWRLTDDEIGELAVEEICRIGFVAPGDVMDRVVIRERKAYPAYFGSYDRFPVIRDFTDVIGNLFLVGRNGMHRYNNQDHSMLSAMEAVANIRGGRTGKENVWSVNTEQDYQEHRITAVENLAEGMLADDGDGEEKYDPDLYWERTQDVYPHYPTVRHRRRFLLAGIERHASPERDGFSLFDYGCGEGTLLAEIRDRFALPAGRLGGCDISAEAVEAARRKTGSTNLHVGPFPRVAVRPSAVVCSEVIEHTADYRSILRWIRENLAPGGFLFLTTQSGKVHASDRYTGHTQHFDIGELNRLLEGLGFELVSSRLWGFPFFSLQKWITDHAMEHVRSHYLEGDLSPLKKGVFGLADALFFLHGAVPLGPQIFIVARVPGGAGSGKADGDRRAGSG